MRHKPADTIKDLLWAIVFAGLAAAVIRFGLGLGAATGLNDASPWGLWIAFKLCFVALAGGGFSLAAMVYIFHLETYRPIVRRAILLALLGYGSFIVSLLFDLGLPWHIYMPIISWQEHSVMFEIAWCVMLYFSVLALEFAPSILEHPWFQAPVFRFIREALHRAVIPLVIAGIVLSTLHQSSLGSLFLIMPHRVHPLWYSPLIPVLFFVSAIAVGMMALIVEGFLAERLFQSDPHADLLEKLGKVGAFALWLYLAIRLGDLAWRGVLPSALDGSWQSLLFGVEMLAGGVLPATLLSIPRLRRSRAGLLTGALLAIGGVASQRLSLSLFTMWRPADTPYTPSAFEVLLAFAIPAAAGLLYFLFVENLPAFSAKPAPSQPEFGQPVLEPRTWVHQTGLRGALVRRTGYAVFAVALAAAFLPSRIASGENVPSVPAQPALGWTEMRIDADRDGIAVLFPHRDHQERLIEQTGDAAQACKTCHHLNKPEDEATACSECHAQVYAPSSIFDHTGHQTALGGNASCTECHTGEHSANTARQCVDCHPDMTPLPGQAVFSPLAPGYFDAMHGACLECHKEQAAATENPDLARCATCHGADTNQFQQASQ